MTFMTETPALDSATDSPPAAHDECRRRNRRERSNGHERLAKFPATSPAEAAGEQKPDADAQCGACGDDESEFGLAQHDAHGEPPHGKHRKCHAAYTQTKSREPLGSRDLVNSRGGTRTLDP